MGKKSFIFTVFLSFTALLSFSQNSDFEKGDSFFYKGPLAFRQALPHYLKAADSMKNDAYFNFKIGRCYLYSKTKEKAIPHLQIALRKKGKKKTAAEYFLGVAYQHNQQFDSAIYHYKAYLTSIKGFRRKAEEKIVNKRITECEYAKKYTAELKEEPVLPFGEVNTEFSDYMAINDSETGKIYFTSRRISQNSNTASIDSLSNQAYEDIFIHDSLTRNFITVNKPFNDAVVSISQNGKYLIIYRSENGGDLFLSEKENGEWSSFEAFPKPINSRFHESSAHISKDGKRLYFVSDRKLKKQHDIYFTEKNEKGEWTKPIALSDSINTIYNEESVFLHPDENLMFFSSQGHSSMGGFDIFYSRKAENGEWTKAQNLGYPINSTENELFYFVSGDGSASYFSSDKKGGKGEHDIYKADVFDDIFALNFFTGKILDADTKENLTAEFELYNTDNEKVMTISTASDSGSYFEKIKPGIYTIRLTTPNYIFYNSQIEIPETNRYDTVFHNIELKKLIEGNAIVVSQIEFDYNEATLRESSFSALDQMALYLEKNPTLKVEISGHTDNVGSRKVNIELSQERAESVVNYLVSKGIKQERLIAKGYAFDKPIDTNETSAGRQNNRRVEFKILQK